MASAGGSTTTVWRFSSRALEIAQDGESVGRTHLDVGEAGRAGVLGRARRRLRILVEGEDRLRPRRHRQGKATVVRERVEAIPLRQLGDAGVVLALIQEAPGLGVLEEIEGEAGAPLAHRDQRRAVADKDALAPRQPFVVAHRAVIARHDQAQPEHGGQARRDVTLAPIDPRRRRLHDRRVAVAIDEEAG